MFETIEESGLDSPKKYYEKLVGQCSEFEHLIDGEAKVEFFFRIIPSVRQGRLELGSVHLPKVQGQLKGIFEWLLAREFDELPDYLILLDMDNWEESSEKLREILIYHELCHTCHAVDKEGELRFSDDGRPVFGLAGHDIEEFTATVSRYGAYSDEIKEFIAAVESDDR